MAPPCVHQHGLGLTSPQRGCDVLHFSLPFLTEPSQPTDFMCRRERGGTHDRTRRASPKGTQNEAAVYEAICALLNRKHSVRRSWNLAKACPLRASRLRKIRYLFGSLMNRTTGFFWEQKENLARVVIARVMWCALSRRPSCPLAADFLTPALHTQKKTHTHKIHALWEIDYLHMHSQKVKKK